MPVLITPQPVRFTIGDMERAHNEWNANCGPGALAAVMQMTLAEVRPHLGDFESKGYTNPTLMWSALRSIGANWHLNRPASAFPVYGLARIQWHGPWMYPPRPIQARYRHTHWVGACTGSGTDIGIFDVNCMNSGGWVSLANWQTQLVPWLLSQCEPKADGQWSITHSVEVVL